MKCRAHEATRLQSCLLSCCSYDARHTMTAMLNTLEQVPGIGTIAGPQLTFEARAVSAREIVRARVAAEVERYNSADDPPRLVGWATPAEPERTLNGPQHERRRPV